MAEGHSICLVCEEEVGDAAAVVEENLLGRAVQLRRTLLREVLEAGH